MSICIASYFCCYILCGVNDNNSVAGEIEDSNKRPVAVTFSDTHKHIHTHIYIYVAVYTLYMDFTFIIWCHIRHLRLAQNSFICLLLFRIMNLILLYTLHYLSSIKCNTQWEPTKECLYSLLYIYCWEYDLILIENVTKVKRSSQRLTCRRLEQCCFMASNY